jgi:hypothetical protein
MTGLELRLRGGGDGRLRDMSFRNFFGVVLLGLGVSAAAHAQLGVYGMYSVNQNTGVQCLSLAPNNCSNGTAGRSFISAGSYGSPSTGHVNPQGLSGGIYYDFKTYGPVRLGVDLRGGDAHSNKSGASSSGGSDSTRASYFLAGVRGSIHTPISWLKPYAQVSVGYSRSDVTEPANTAVSPGTSTVPPRYFDDYLQYEGFVGADVKVLPFLDLRAIELGLGNMNRIGSGSSADGNSSVGVRSLGAGVVFHMP